MSAPSPVTSMQTPQREFALQRYYNFMRYANKSEKLSLKNYIRIEPIPGGRRKARRNKANNGTNVERVPTKR